MITQAELEEMFGLDTLAEDLKREETPQEKMAREIDEFFPNGI